MKKKYKPGPGWEYLGSSVWEKGNIRIHVGGELIRSNGRYVGLRSVRNEISRFIKINGDNRKRGLMAFVNNLYTP